jgi:hypothetical protein
MRDSISFLDVAGLEAPGADARAARAAVDDDAHLVDVGRPAPLGLLMRMAHVEAELGLLPAYVTHVRQSIVPFRSTRNDEIAHRALKANEMRRMGQIDWLTRCK